MKSNTGFRKGKRLEGRGYRIDVCSGSTGCPNRAVVSDSLPEKIEGLFNQVDFGRFLQDRSRKGEKPHRGLRVAVADCPNACTQPQIKDIGIIGACAPRITGEGCIQCGECVDACKENSIALRTSELPPRIDEAECLVCGQCIRVCPTATLADGLKGFRVLLGGKLGRHPSLARELPGIYGEQTVLDIIRDCIGLYMERAGAGERLGQILTSSDFEELVKQHPPLPSPTGSTSSVLPPPPPAVGHGPGPGR